MEGAEHESGQSECHHPQGRRRRPPSHATKPRLAASFAPCLQLCLRVPALLDLEGPFDALEPGNSCLILSLATAAASPAHRSPHEFHLLLTAPRSSPAHSRAICSWAAILNASVFLKIRASAALFVRWFQPERWEHVPRCLNSTERSFKGQLFHLILTSRSDATLPAHAANWFRIWRRHICTPDWRRVP